jgi:hypothetical protein
MIESSLGSMVSISPEGMITDANEATVRLTGVRGFANDLVMA